MRLGINFTPPRTLQGVMTLPVSASAAPNNGKVCIILLMYLVSSGCSLKSTSSSSIFLINPVLANSEWGVCRKVVVKHSINQIKPLNESTRITRASGTWSCHRHYFQTIGANSYMSDENRNEWFKFLLRQISSLQVGDSHNW